MSKSIKAPFVIVSLLALIAVIFIGLGSALVPLILSFVISYLFFPLVKKLESKGVKRNYVVSGIFLMLVVTIGLTLALILPGLISDTQSFLSELPENSAKAVQKIEIVSSSFGYDLNINKSTIVTYIKKNASKLSDDLLHDITSGLKSSVTGIASWIIGILNIFLIPLFFFYVINDYEKLSNEIKSFIPKSVQPKLSHYFELSNKVASGYIRGQLMVALILGILYALGLWAVGLRFGLLIGLLSGLISIIPYAGFTLGFTAAIIVALANYSGIGLICGISGVFLIVQTFEGFYITPKIVGDKVGLSSLATILSLVIGGNLLGLTGMLIAIPTAAICKTLLEDLKSEYQKLEIYNKN